MRIQPKILLLIMAGLVLTIFIVQLLMNSRFRVVSVIPNNKGVVATSSTTLKLEFNRELNPNINYSERFEDPQGIIESYTIEDKVLFLYLDELNSGARYRFSVKDIMSLNNEKIENFEFDFVAEYIPYARLSKAQQQLHLEATDRYINEDPLAEHLPVSGLSYKISGVYEATEEEEPTYAINIEILLSNVDIKINREEAIERYRREAFEKIRSLGFEPTNYPIRYLVIDPS